MQKAPKFLKIPKICYFKKKTVAYHGSFFKKNLALDPYLHLKTALGCETISEYKSKEICLDHNKNLKRITRLLEKTESL